MMDNTIQNRQEFNTSTEPQFRSAPMGGGYQVNQGDVVYFIIDLEEMFGISLDYPGIKGALNNAFFESRQYVPVDTGLMKRSYSMKPRSDAVVECLFDPTEIIGQTRKGRVVDEYYPKFVGSSGAGNSAWNWLTIVVSHFVKRLIAEVRALQRSEIAKERKDEGRSSPIVGETALSVLASIEATRKSAAEAKKTAEEKKKRNDRLERKRRA